VIDVVEEAFAVAADRKPAQLRCKHGQQHQADIEHRHRQPDLEDAAYDRIRGSMPVERCDKGERHRNRQRNDGGHRGQHQGDGQALCDQLDHRQLEPDRIAEVAGQHRSREEDELHGDRPVEAELGFDPFDIGVDRAVAEHGACRISRQQPDDDEGDDQDEDDGRNGLQDAPEDEAEERQIGDPDPVKPPDERRTASAARLSDVAVYFSSHVARKMLLPSGICRKSCTFLLSVTG
jgi:hypothetical protein